MFTWLAPDRLYLDYGPIQATISAYRLGRPMHYEMEAACEYAAAQLKELAACLPLAKLPPEKVKGVKKLPDALFKMMGAVEKCGDSSLTSMAAVAGTFADMIADFLTEKGATKVMVSNGGDLALRLADGEFVKVGIVSDINQKSFSHMIKITAQSEIRGVATSGFGGRSFTKGIASAAVAFGGNCREADAAATLIGNHCFSPDPAIRQVPAETLDPDTDIKGHMVTLSIGELSPDTTGRAIKNGITKAIELMEQKVIIGAAIFVQEESAVLPEQLAKEIQLVKQN
ncbi:MAG: FAD:protein FMN transferase [Dehalobacterium sp.]